KWRSYLLSLSEPFEVLTDHNALKYFMSSKVLTRPVVPDALSRQDNVYPREGEAFANNNPDNVQTIFSPLTHFDSPKVYLNSMTLHSKTLKLQDAQLSDPRCRDIQNNIALHSKDYSISKNNLLLQKMIFSFIRKR
ncbi:uncharacterized protein VP01_13435g1, partial [Puccinia sorghi]